VLAIVQAGWCGGVLIAPAFKTGHRKQILSCHKSRIEDNVKVAGFHATGQQQRADQSRDTENVF